eukprot:m.114435 g.114435  ORF g.114435 m.114435 type:complete len:396 (-) comp13053_c0_seq1:5318-6505(-)
MAWWWSPFCAAPQPNFLANKTSVYAPHLNLQRTVLFLGLKLSRFGCQSVSSGVDFLGPVPPVTILSLPCSAKPTMSVVELLRSVSVADLAPAKPILTLKSSENPREAYKKLAARNVRSAPVFDERTKRYIGFLDIRDLIAFIVYENSEADLRAAVDAKGDTTQFIDRLLTAGAQMYDLPLEGVSLSSLARRHGFRCVGSDATLDDVAKLLVHKGCHRVPVMNMEGEIVNIISQSSIIKFLDSNNERLGALGRHTIAQSMCGTSPVLSVKATDSVLDAFKLMAVNDITGVAIVDDSGELIANTSATDLKLFLQNPSVSLGISVLEFTSKVRQLDLKAVYPAMGVKPSDTLAHVLGKLAAAKVHRLFVVDNKRATSVVSLTDIIRYIYMVSLVKGDE